MTSRNQATLFFQQVIYHCSIAQEKDIQSARIKASAISLHILFLCFIKHCKKDIMYCFWYKVLKLCTSAFHPVNLSST
jgi:hypothetical protein